MSSTQVLTPPQPRVYRRRRRASVKPVAMPKRDQIGPTIGFVSFSTFGCEEPTETQVSTDPAVPKTPTSDDISATSSADESDSSAQSSNNTSGYGTPPSEVDEPVKLGESALPPLTIPPRHSHKRKASVAGVCPRLLRRLSVYSSEKPTAAVTSPTTVSREMNPLTIDDWGLRTKAPRAQDALVDLVRTFHGPQVGGHSDDDEN